MEITEKHLRLAETLERLGEEHGQEVIWSLKDLSEESNIPEAELFEHDNFTRRLRLN